MRIVYEKTNLASLVAIIDDDSSITRFPSDTHHAIQADPDTLLQMAVAIGLELTPIITFFTQNNIPFNMTPQQEQIFRDRAFGIRFAADVVDRIKNMEEMSVAARGQLISKIHLFLTVLHVGDVLVARAVMNSYVVDQFLTEPRKTWVLNQLDAYLNA